MAHLFISSDSNYDIDIQRKDLSDLKLIDSGGFGTVFKGIWNKGKENEQEVAIKYLIRKDTLQVKKDFIREHSKNVLVHNGKALLGDFGLSKYLLEENDGHISEREKSENGTPLDYKKIYEKCWSAIPSLRPEIPEILNCLNILKSSPTYQGDNVSMTFTESYCDSNCSSAQSFDESFDQIIIENWDNSYTSCPKTPLEEYVNFSALLQCIKEAYKLFEEIKVSYKNAQLNTRICGVLNRCINSAEYNLKNLEEERSNHATFATSENYRLFQIFLQNIRKIKDFIKAVSNIRGLKNRAQKTHSGFSLELIKIEFEQLLDEFNESMSSIKFESYIDKEAKNAVNGDIEETTKFLRDIQLNFKGNDNNIFNIIELTSTRLVTKRKFSDAEFLENSIQKVDNLNVVKLKRYNSNQKGLLCIHAALLKNLGNLVNIIKFYGILQDDSSSDSIFLVTEISEHGNLKEYYTNHKHLDLSVKLKFALDICIALVFLNAVNFLHRDLRSENILITTSLNAKITNFYHGRLNSDDTNDLEINIDRIKSTPPEILKRKHHSVRNYDSKSEIYSCMPQKYIDIMMRALEFEPNNRPTICDIFKVLHDVVNNPRISQRSGMRSLKRGMSQSSFSSIDNAVNEAKKENKNKQKALDYIDKFADLGNPKAIYYKGHFLQQKLHGKYKISAPNEYKRIQEEVARLFESASNKNFTIAHTKYGDCLFNGYGVVKNQAHAIGLYKKAANDDNAYAKYRLGIIYYEGLAGVEDKEEGAHYLKLAACENYKKAIDACKKYNITY
ncbi:22938_t:CDS:2 [Cetraspora pellucida]|uniref:22938_t:CDS:1 n=1 Tax=Cetraspora pellucida TaxID=1433469 RepID=A0A9N9DSF1_9GLOM|nr:22938_t:CDS:2 [Cetraspora pellucida]